MTDAEFTYYDWDANKDRLTDHVGHFLTLSLFKDFKRPDVAIEPLFELRGWRKTYLVLACITAVGAVVAGLLIRPPP